MAGLIIGWEYLTGCCVATSPSSRQRAEWPPHPGRVFMALAAAWFETGEREEEGAALRWLETLGPPQMLLPSPDRIGHRTILTVFVPVNDSAGPSAAMLQSAPITRSKQPRTFPTVWVGEAQCFLCWPDAGSNELDTYCPVLDRLCGEVTRIGHSSSVVRMWSASNVAVPDSTETWVPEDGLADFHARSFSEGTLDTLERQFNRRGREEHDRLAGRITELNSEKPKGQGAKQRKEEIKTECVELVKQLELVNGHDLIRPKLGLWTGYRRHESAPLPPAPHTDFDSDLLILTQIDGPRLPLSSTLTVTRALRGAVMSHIGVRIPEWVSGHHTNGEPLRTSRQHLAFITLPFVGNEHADGHLLGVALVFPREIPRPERGRHLGHLVMNPSGEPREIALQLGQLGVIKLIRGDWSERRVTLQPETWIGHPDPAAECHQSRCWATVTPVVLDRFPKSDPGAEREAWLDEVTGIIATGCSRVGLPIPTEVTIGTTSWHHGSPRATVKRRPLRGHPELANASASLGDGFPSYPHKGGNGIRPQVHAFLRFTEPVVGPILLGAGRFLGYGLCKPLLEGTAQ